MFTTIFWNFLIKISQNVSHKGHAMGPSSKQISKSPGTSHPFFKMFSFPIFCFWRTMQGAVYIWIVLTRLFPLLTSLWTLSILNPPKWSNLYWIKPAEYCWKKQQQIILNINILLVTHVQEWMWNIHVYCLPWRNLQYLGNIFNESNDEIFYISWPLFFVRPISKGFTKYSTLFNGFTRDNLKVKEGLLYIRLTTVKLNLVVHAYGSYERQHGSVQWWHD